MADFLQQLSLMPRGIRYKLGVAFFLMALIPLFVCAFFVFAYIAPETRLTASGLPLQISSTWILIIMGITAIIAALGFWVMKQVIDPVVTITAKARRVADGHLEAPFEVDREDEVGDLAESLNKITFRIKETISELRSYGERTKQINLEIHKKVLALSNLLQIGNLISGGGALSEILTLVMDKISQLDMVDDSFIYLLEEGSGSLSLILANGGKPEALPARVEIGRDFLGKLASHGEPVVSDAATPSAPEAKEFKEAFGIQNLASFPITVRGTVRGVLGIGNVKEGYRFSQDDMEMLKVFVKQTAIAVENDLLVQRAKELQVKDDLTQLYNEDFARQRLEEEIKRAVRYQRPCSFVFFDIDGFQALEPSSQPELLKRFAKTLQATVTEIDRAARFERDLFGVILPERNKKEATQLAEGLRQKVERELRVTLSAGVSENPIDGASAELLLQKAKEALGSAKALGKNRVVA